MSHYRTTLTLRLDQKLGNMSLPVLHTFILFLLTTCICGALEATPSDIRVAGFKEGKAVLKTRLKGTVGWYKNGVPITNLLKSNSEFGRKMYLSPRGNLILQSLDLSDRGRYMCVGLDENHQNQSQIYDLAVYDASETVPVQTGQAGGQEQNVQIFVWQEQRVKLSVQYINQQILHRKDVLQTWIEHNVQNITKCLLDCYSRLNSTNVPSCGTLADSVNVSRAGTEITLDGVTNSGQFYSYVCFKKMEPCSSNTISIVTNIQATSKSVFPIADQKPLKTPMHSLGTEIVAGIYILILGLVLAVKLGLT